MNLLIVDDDPTNLKLLRAQLESEGHAVFEAHDGVDALALLERQPVDAVISDILMPRMDGYRLCHEIRTRLHDLPVILCTSTYTSPGDEKLVLDVGADKYLKRPVSREAIVAALYEVIAQPHAAPRSEALQEIEVLKEYSERLVSKLEEKTTELMAAYEELHQVLAHSPAVLYRLKVEGQNIIMEILSDNMERLLGVARKDTHFEWWKENLHPEDRKRALTVLAQGLKGDGYSMAYRIRHKDGTYRWVEDNNRVVREASDQPKEMIGVWMDITERKQAEETLQKSEKRFRAIVEHSLEEISLVDSDGTLTYESPTLRRPLGYPPNSFVGHNLFDLFHPDERVAATQLLKQVEKHPGSVQEAVFRLRHQDGSWRWMEGSLTNLLDEPAVQSVVINYRDITERKQAEVRIQRQLEHLTALSGIDRVISANFDLKLSLSEILKRVTVELGVDAADILIVNSGLQILEYGAERGFRSKAIRNTPLRFGESFAGRIVLERQLIRIPNLSEEPNILFLTTRLTGEDFICYYGVPLIIKGQVKGVLEIFHRAALQPDAEWLDFLNTLAGEAAIAVEIATLFESLQRSNLELFQAYDATIEGWSQAMDMRDKETEGHTQRATEMTVKIGRAFGLSEKELVQVRWGALLHDIGKLGVPDGILLKPGPLTDEEWVVMKKHPTFAYEMLSPIHYLRQALDIPYYHHEKWDGTGYPNGLKGTQIPLVARIFAVVDVWDALKSGRPYRAGWTEEKVLEHIRTLSGTHFDPQVVDAFMQIQNII